MYYNAIYYREGYTSDRTISPVIIITFATKIQNH